MIHLDWTTPDHWRAIHEITKGSILLFSDQTFAEFAAVHFRRQGFTIFNGKKVIGYISFSDYLYPGLDVAVHVTVDKKYRGQWFNPELLRPVMNFVKGILKLMKLTAVTIVGHTDHLGKTIEKAGFQYETRLPGAFTWQGKKYDLKTYGLYISQKGN